MSDYDNLCPCCGEIECAKDTDNVGGLPELPTQVADVYFTDDDFDLSFMPGMPCNNGPLYTADQMRAYGELCRAAPAGGDGLRLLVKELRESLEGVVRVADRQTDEFDRAREAIARAAHVFVNAGDSEAQFIADGENLDCPACGGSGHAGDSAPAGSGEVETMAVLKSWREPDGDAPSHSLPDWSECQLRVHNSRFIAERMASGGFGPDPDDKLATELHRFIYEYDDADRFRSGWFMHRLERVLNEQSAALLRKLQQGADYVPAFWNVRKDGKHLILFPLNGAVTITTYLEMVAGAHPGAAIDAETLYRAASPRKEAFNG